MGFFQAEDLEKVREQLSSTDSIMEPNVIYLIPKFLKAGGTPQEVWESPLLPPKERERDLEIENLGYDRLFNCCLGVTWGRPRW